MRGVYTASIKIEDLSAAETLMFILSPDTMVTEILSASVTNATAETNEQLEFNFQRISSLGNPVGSGITPSPHEPGDAASSVVVSGHITASEPTYAADQTFGHQGVASLGGWFFDPTPEERLYISPSNSIGLQIINAPTIFDALCNITFREIGG